MSFKVGQQVMVLDENLAGVIKKINKQAIFIETIDGFLLEYRPDELVLNSQENTLHVNTFKNSGITKVLQEKEQPKRKQQRRVKSKERHEPTMEVDLHIHQLVKSYKGMSNHDMLTLQLDTARHKLDWAIKKRIQKMVFIHGVGEGVLKTELDYFFDRYDNIKFYDANYQKYGLGATEVYIFQNPTS